MRHHEVGFAGWDMLAGPCAGSPDARLAGGAPGSPVQRSPR